MLWRSLTYKWLNSMTRERRSYLRPPFVTRNHIGFGPAMRRRRTDISVEPGFAAKRPRPEPFAPVRRFSLVNDKRDPSTVLLPSRATLKTIGYIISSLSVALLGIVSWKAASADTLLLVCLVAGMAASAIGMLLRRISYQLDQG
jgi:hypothetical protein